MRVTREAWVALRTRAEPPPKRCRIRAVYEVFASVTIALLLALFIFVFIARPVVVDGQSMEPTLHNNDWVILQAIPSKPKHGDILVIMEQKSLNKCIIKRAIALPGDTLNIDYAKGQVIRNNQTLTEPYIAESTAKDFGFKLPVTVGSNRIFVMGDNRNHSKDSRSPDIGLIDQNNVLGKVLFHFSLF
ncbi:MAG: signal peptidase I [Oscillospiraceae bacterium]|jgi:signal peptidase I|nr:signal peptidase I [Oscillospiraceae bacterium]